MQWFAPTRSNVAVYTLATVRSGDRVLAVGAPVHVMTSSRDNAALELDVGEPRSPVQGLPGEYDLGPMPP